MTEPLPNLSVKVTADVDDAVAGLAEVKAAEKSVGDQSDKTTAKVKTNSKAQGQASTDLKKLLVDNVQDGQKAYVSIGKSIDDTQTKIVNLKKEFADSGSVGVFGDLQKAKSDLKGLQSIAADMAPEGKRGGQSFLTAFSDTLEGASPLALGIGALIPAIGLAVTAGVGIGIAGIGVAIERNNPQVKAAFQKLAADGSSVLKDAASPLVKPLAAQLTALDGEIKFLKPELTSLFTAAVPGLNALSKGVGGFAQDLLPGLIGAAKDGAPVISEIGKDLPELGASLGYFIKELADTPGAVKSVDAVFTTLERTLNVLGPVLKVAGAALPYLIDPIGTIKTDLVGMPQINEAVAGSFTKVATQAAYAAGSGIDPLTAAVEAQTAKTYDDTQAWIALTAAQGKNAADALIASNTYLQMKQAQTVLGETLKQNKDNFNLNTKAGQADTAAYLTLIDATEKQYGVQNGAIPTTQKATKAALDATEQLYEQAKAAGANSTVLVPLTKEISALKTQLAGLKSRDISVNVHVNETGITGSEYNRILRAGGGNANSGIERYANSGVAGGIGGMPHYDNTGIYAGGNQPLYRFAEQSTIQEALVAKNGDSGRAMMALREAAGWHGMALTPATASGAAASTGRSHGAPVNITVPVIVNGQVVATALIPDVQRIIGRSSVNIYGGN